MRKGHSSDTEEKSWPDSYLPPIFPEVSWFSSHLPPLHPELDEEEWRHDLIGMAPYFLKKIPDLQRSIPPVRELLETVKKILEYSLGLLEQGVESPDIRKEVECNRLDILLCFNDIASQFIDLVLSDELPLYGEEGKNMLDGVKSLLAENSDSLKSLMRAVNRSSVAMQLGESTGPEDAVDRDILSFIKDRTHSMCFAIEGLIREVGVAISDETVVSSQFGRLRLFGVNESSQSSVLERAESPRSPSPSSGDEEG